MVVDLHNQNSDYDIIGIRSDSLICSSKITYSRYLVWCVFIMQAGYSLVSSLAERTQDNLTITFTWDAVGKRLRVKNDGLILERFQIARGDGKTSHEYICSTSQ